MSISGSNVLRLTYKLLFVAVTAAVTAAASEYLMRNNLSNEDTVNVIKYKAVFRNQSGTDIFVLGNSQSAYGIIPSLLKIPGHKVHNYSFPGASPSYNKDLYERYLARYQEKPKLIIYGVSWFMFDSKVPPRKVAQDHQFVPWGVEMLRVPPHERLYLIHQNDVLSRMFKRPKDKTILVDKYDDGFVPLEEKYLDRRTKVEPRVKNSEKEMSSFLELVSMIQANGVELLFVEAPEYNRGVQCESILPNEELLWSLARSRRIEYINFNRERRSEINDDPSYFGDQRHLNYAGAQRFSKMLSDDINDLIMKGKISLD